MKRFNTAGGELKPEFFRFFNPKVTMQDSKSVITTAAKPIVEELRKEYEVGTTRMYEILSTDNPYPKTKKLIRRIGRLNKEGARLIKADLDAMFCEILGEEFCEPSDAELAKELCDVFHARLAGKSRADRLHECRQALAVLHREMAAIEKECD